MIKCLRWRLTGVACSWGVPDPKEEVRWWPVEWYGMGWTKAETPAPADWNNATVQHSKSLSTSDKWCHIMQLNKAMILTRRWWYRSPSRRGRIRCWATDHTYHFSCGQFIEVSIELKIQFIQVVLSKDNIPFIIHFQATFTLRQLPTQSFSTFHFS